MNLILSLLQQAAGGAPAAGTPAAGAPAAGPQQPPQGGLLSMMVPLILMFVVMYFLMIRPQRKQQLDRDKMISALKKNDHVLTNAGIHGIVKQVRADEAEVTLCVDEKKDVCIRVTKSSIASLVKASASSETESKPEEAAKKA